MHQQRLNKIYSYLKILLKKNNKAVRKNLNDWGNSFINPDEFYLDCFRYFYFNLPSGIRAHKKYFNKQSRGFGEKAFHSMWYLLLEKYQFSNFLEIGIYRGQTISLIGLLANLQKKEIFLQGISPFDNSGDRVSNYVNLDYLNDVNKNFRHFSLKPPKLLKAYSTDPVAHDVISSLMWDSIYIDGSHDYEVVKKDWAICSKNIKIGGIIVLDDASLNTNYDAPFFAFKGHPGPSKIADEILSEYFNFKEVLRVGHNRIFERIY